MRFCVINLKQWPPASLKYIIGFIFFIPVALSAQVNLNQGLIAYYPFDGNANDASGNGHNGILHDGVTFGPDRNNSPNSAVYFDGINDFIEVPNNGDLSPSGAFSFVVQFKTNDISKVQTLLARRRMSDQTQAQFQTFINWSLHPGFGYAHDYTNNTACNTSIVLFNQYVSTGAGTIQRDQWHCVVGTFDGSFQKIYLDGTLMEALATPLSLMDICQTVPMTIGKYTDQDPQFFKGAMDEIRIYNRALTLDEVVFLCPKCSVRTSSDTAVCSGSSIQFHTTGADSYSWTPTNGLNSSTIPDPIASPASTTQYIVTGTTTSGCISKDTVQVTVNQCSSPCNNWLKLPSQPSYFRIGDLDVTGDKITVEASFNRTAPWSGTDLFQGDLVSKHQDPSDCNYLLRPGSAEITTTNGYFKTPEICQIELNKTYHVAMVYDGVTLKFYRNGFLMSQMAASGNLVQNNWQTQVGLYFNQLTQEQFIGYINEVRIWNIARTQNEIKAYMDQSLPNPQTTSGLLAYYTFDNLVNKQGNATWNGVLGGNATINETNPNCTHILDSCKVLSTNVQPSFVIPDTVCVNTPVKITNTSTGASSYYWNFCVADMNVAPSGTNLGNTGGSLSAPVFMDYAFYNGNYYGFLINYNPGSLIRLDFGNNLLNTPTAVNLGNFGGIIPPGSGAEGIQIVFNEGKWYAIVVGGWPTTGSTPRILKIEFGPNLDNPAPVATNWGNLGNMLQPIDLHVFKEGNNWYGFTVNAENNTITRFNFTNSFSNMPTAVNLGNIGNLSYPTGIYAINDNGFWRVFVVNAGNNTRQTGTYSLSRLDFGSSLLNTPTGVNLGNPGNLLQHPRDLTIMKMCDQIIGFAVNGHMNNSNIIKLNFNNNLSSIPSLTSLGIIGNSSFPHSISKLFRVENDLYGFITNVDNNTITRLKFNGCTNSSIPNSNLQNPPSVVYNTPGVYNINLTVDDGLPTQGTFCKQVVVVGPPAHAPIQNVVLCKGDNLKIGAAKGLKSYLWNTNETTDSISINTAGIYWVESDSYGCTNRDSFDLVLKNKPLFSLRGDTSICRGESIVLSTQASENYTYSWTPSAGLSNSSASSPVAIPTATTQYVVKAMDSSNCVTADTVAIVVKDKPTVQLGSDTSLCAGDTLLLNAANPGSAYQWQNGANSQTFTVRDSGVYHVQVTKDGCSSSDTLSVALRPMPVFSLSDTTLCEGQTVTLSAQAKETYTYNWSPAAGLSNASIPNPAASPTTTTSYVVTGKDSKGCTGKDTVTVTVYPKPAVTISNDVTICSKSPTQLHAGGGVSYQWFPQLALSSVNVPDPVANPTSTTVYHVSVTDQNNCANTDSVTVFVHTITTFNKPANAQVCEGDSVQFIGDNTFTYLWSPAASLSDAHIANPYAFPASTTVYTVTATDAVCNRDTVFNVMVTVNPKPQVTARKSNDINCTTPTSQLNASGAVRYFWSPAKGLDNPLRSNPTAVIDTTTTFTVTGKNEFGCYNTDTVTVEVNSIGQMFTHIPNAFTPNGDGKNDCFGIKKWGLVSELEFSIFNRWGELVFFTKDPGRCWDGTYKGTLQPSDAYVYIIKANSMCGKIFLKGTFLLIK
jgi:gliding motility-associated-like protein